MERKMLPPWEKLNRQPDEQQGKEKKRREWTLFYIFNDIK